MIAETVFTICQSEKQLLQRTKPKNKSINLLNDNETKDKYCHPAGGGALRRQHAGVEAAAGGGAADDGGGVPLPRCGHRDGLDDDRTAHQPPTAD